MSSSSKVSHLRTKKMVGSSPDGYFINFNSLDGYDGDTVWAITMRHYYKACHVITVVDTEDDAYEWVEENVDRHRYGYYDVKENTPWYKGDEHAMYDTIEVFETPKR